jgi:hypothetical protein
MMKRMGVNYNIFYYCSHEAKIIRHEDAIYSSAFRLVCPDCGMRLRTMPKHRKGMIEYVRL